MKVNMKTSDKIKELKRIHKLLKANGLKQKKQANRKTELVKEWNDIYKGIDRGDRELYAEKIKRYLVSA